MSHAAAWRSTWLLIVTLGIGLGVLEWGPLIVVPFLAGATVMTLPAVVAASRLRLRARAPGVPTRRDVLARAVTLSAVVVAWWAVVRLAPSLGFLLLMLAVVSSPAAVAPLRRATGRRPSATAPMIVRPDGAAADDAEDAPGGAGPVPPLEKRPRPQDLDDRALCQLWRQSFWDLANQRTPSGYLRVVAWRQCCLDEMERRDAEALHAWLDSGARASGGPEKFLRHPPGGTTDAV